MEKNKVKSIQDDDDDWGEPKGRCVKHEKSRKKKKKSSQSRTMTTRGVRQRAVIITHTHAHTHPPTHPPTRPPTQTHTYTHRSGGFGGGGGGGSMKINIKPLNTPSDSAPKAQQVNTRNASCIYIYAMCKMCQCVRARERAESTIVLFS